MLLQLSREILDSRYGRLIYKRGIIILQRGGQLLLQRKYLLFICGNHQLRIRHQGKQLLLVQLFHKRTQHFRGNRFSRNPKPAELFQQLIQRRKIFQNILHRDFPAVNQLQHILPGRKAAVSHIHISNIAIIYFQIRGSTHICILWGGNQTADCLCEAYPIIGQGQRIPHLQSPGIRKPLIQPDALCICRIKPDALQQVRLVHCILILQDYICLRAPLLWRAARHHHPQLRAVDLFQASDHLQILFGKIFSVKPAVGQIGRLVEGLQRLGRSQIVAFQGDKQGHGQRRKDKQRKKLAEVSPDFPKHFSKQHFTRKPPLPEWDAH